MIVFKSITCSQLTYLLILTALSITLNPGESAADHALPGSLPYRHLNYPAREPYAGPAIRPAYKGGSTKAVTPEDTGGTADVPLSAVIAEQAQALKWSPVLIYEYMMTHIETEWYWGCMKGAEETLRQGSGNDCDQATLLSALMRASGFPTRYVRGAVEFFAGGSKKDMDKTKNLFGIDNPAG
ncbi:MAG: hypothetical protein C0402_11300, partial [Thermodesulfovibrio sp.]|nr:hypothetical protein [Thermodesulfovibrio sp.]